MGTGKMGTNERLGKKGTNERLGKEGTKEKKFICKLLLLII